MYFAHTPGLKVVCPATAYDAKGLIKSAIRDNNPVIFSENPTLYALKGDIPDDPNFTVPFGKAQVLREGKDVSLVAYSRMTHTCLAAAEILEKDGIDVEVVDVRLATPEEIQFGVK